MSTAELLDTGSRLSTPPRAALLGAVRQHQDALALSVLILSAGANGISGDVHGLSVYPEYLALGAVTTWLAYRWSSGAVQWFWPRPVLLLLPWLAVALLATVLHAPDRHHSLILWTKLPLMVATYLLVANLARRRLAWAVATQAATAVLVAALAILSYGAWKLTGSHLGMQHPGLNLGRSWLPDGTLREPNILGSYLVAATLLSAGVARSIGAERPRLRILAWGAATASAFGVVLSGSRTAWLALLGAGLVSLLYMAARRPRAVLRQALAPAALIGLAAVGVFLFRAHDGTLLPAFNPQQTGTVSQRVASFGSLSKDRDIVVRVDIARNALAHWRQHPVIGWGVGAYGEVYTYPPPDTVHRGWISNLEVHLLYDSGLLGLLAFLVALALAGWRGVRAWLEADGPRRAILAGLLLALLALFAAFQATEATWFAYPWVYLGLLEAAIWKLGGSSYRPVYGSA